jgi:large subunit ribosomal protein L25
LMNSIEVRCLPSNLPESVEIDVSGFNIDDTISLSELKLPKDVELMAFAHGGDKEEHDALVVKLHIPRVEVEEEVAPVVAEGEVPLVEGEAPAAEGAAPAPAEATKEAAPAKDKEHKDKK